uniref:Uncharacterized protein n=1 Tax=Bactrocera latifrons TaxID=174628 RepID=A0A0K8V762_BACLA
MNLQWMTLPKTMHPLMTAAVQMLMTAAVQMLMNPQDKLLPHHLLGDVGAESQKLPLIGVEETQLLKGEGLPQPKEMPEGPQAGHQLREQRLKDQQQPEDQQAEDQQAEDQQAEDQQAEDQQPEDQQPEDQQLEGQQPEDQFEDKPLQIEGGQAEEVKG